MRDAEREEPEIDFLVPRTALRVLVVKFQSWGRVGQPSQP